MKEIEVIAIYCIIDDILKSLGWEDDRQTKMSSSEVLINLEESAILYADKGYADYEIGDLLKEVKKINLMPIRKNQKGLIHLNNLL